MTLGFDTLTVWWRERSARERMLLLSLTVIGLSLIVWYGIASPLQRTARQSELHRARAAQLLTEVESARAAMSALVIPSGAEISDVLTLSATEAGFALESQREENAREIAVSGHAPDSTVLFGWIGMLRKNHGLVVANLTTTRDETGVLRVDVVLMRGGT